MYRKTCKIQYFSNQLEEVMKIVAVLEKAGYLCVHSHKSEGYYILIAKKEEKAKK